MTNRFIGTRNYPVKKQVKRWGNQRIDIIEKLTEAEKTDVEILEEFEKLNISMNRKELIKLRNVMIKRDDDKWVR